MNNIPSAFSLPFLKNEQVAKDAYAFYFDTSAHPFSFLPGQYIRMILPLESPDERGNRRLFSLAYSPLEKKYLRIITRVIQSSFKKALLELQPGTPVNFWGPAGRFVLDEQEVTPKVFLAGGIGVTPFISMLEYATQKRLTTPLTLFVSFSSPEDCIYYAQFIEYTKEYSQIKIVYTITRPDATASWKGEIGRISETMIRKYVHDAATSSLYYISGPDLMVDAMESIVMGMGVPEDLIRKEIFTGY